MDVYIRIGRATSARLGDVWLALSEKGLVALEFGVCREDFEASVQRQLRARVEPPHPGSQSEAVSDAAAEVTEYLAGRRRAFEMSIDWDSLPTPFQRRALQAVYAIPYGETRTYGEIAAEIGYPQAPRAVGRANATNPMPLVIPCHRVIGSDGKLHGYGGAGGLKTKKWLLELEGGRAAELQLTRT